MRKTTVLLLAATLAAPAPLLAQGTTGEDAAHGETQREDRGFPWGLLGLVGLAGLLGRKRRDDDAHVDARRDRT